MCNKMDELMGFPGDSVVKGPPAHAGDMGSIPDPGRSYIPQSNKTLVPQLLSLCSAAAAAAKSLQSYPTLCDRIDGSPPGSRPWNSPGKNTGEGCHVLPQCMKVKSKSEVAQSCPTLRNPMDCSLPGSSVHGISQARVLE